LATAVQAGDLEVASRGIEILRDMLAADPPLAEAASAALEACAERFLGVAGGSGVEVPAWLDRLTTAVDRQALLDNLRHPARLVVDARAADRFRGQNETIDPVAGHIPGAVNRFFRDNLDTMGFFKPAAELRAAFTPLVGTHAPAQVVHSCGSGVSACHNLLAMEIAGLGGTRLYPGSWSEWCSDPSRPVET
jgi:thiosulfate/3-mercaptopyruvate sulfurtransferase